MFDEVVSLKNLFSAWHEFRKGKEDKIDVQEFALHLEDQMFMLRESLEEGTYRHGPYHEFYLRDPKLRHIHKADVRDRLLHHALMRVLELVFERGFIYDSYASRIGKGLHKAVDRFRRFAWSVSKNNTRTVWVLQGDIRKFFDTVDHGILLKLLARNIKDERVFRLLNNLLSSFSSAPGRGLPLGNVTSQLFANVYMNELDQFVKRQLRIPYYLRYADDFLFVSEQKERLESVLSIIRRFLNFRLHLELHERKVTLRKWNQGIDFLGYVSFPHHAILRTKTKQRMLRKAKIFSKVIGNDTPDISGFDQTLRSYGGVLGHCRGFNVSQELLQRGKAAKKCAE